ncbi:MAG: D-alanine--D-alanine ligase [Acidobacteria bacterium]|nr:D-alanine--D-alanine ligase [Acidobacteriota bacterium]
MEIVVASRFDPLDIRFCDDNVASLAAGLSRCRAFGAQTHGGPPSVVAVPSPEGLRKATEGGLSAEEAAEFDSLDPIDHIDRALSALGHSVDRIGGIRALCRRLSDGDRWDLVWNICEGHLGDARESQVPGLLDAFGIPYVFSGPHTLTLCLHKPWSKRVLRDAGIPTARFQVVRGRRDLSRVDIPYPLFIKPVAEGSGKGVTAESLVNERSDLESRCMALIGTFGQPVLVEEYLPGRELTVGILGTDDDAAVAGVMEVSIPPDAERNVYSYHYKYVDEAAVVYRLVNDSAAVRAGELALGAWRLLGCRDAGRIDFRLDRDGSPCLIELNPLAGLNAVHSDLPTLCGFAGIAYTEMIRRIVESAMKRCRLKP